MLGKAQLLFLEKYGGVKNSSTLEEIFPQIDYSFAQCILQGKGSEGALAALCYLSFCSRNGNICIKSDEDIIPKMWLGEDFCYEQVKKGLKELPEDLFGEDKPLVRKGKCIYLQRNWYYENLFLEHYQRVLSAKPSLEMNTSNKNLLLPEQQEAIRKVCDNTVTIITGGPGTGKTYTAGYILEDVVGKVAVAAPTGKAAANIQRSLLKNNPQLEGKITAKTLHSLLRINSFDQMPSTLDADFILIDECSMVDVKMMALLFASIKTGARVVLLGDENQLPPVEVGSVFADLTRWRGGHCLVALQKCMRTELQSIVEFSRRVKEGSSTAALHVIHSDKYPEVSAVDIDDMIKNFMFLEESYCILSPLRRGHLGVDYLNSKILKSILRRDYNKHWLRIPIMITRNNYDLGLYNGEVGTLVCKNSNFVVNKRFEAGDYAIFHGCDKRYSAMLLPDFDFAYCISVHKSQGSEFDRVGLVIPKGSEVFGRGIFYTAATRAKKKLDIYGSDEMIEKVVRQSDVRISGIG